MQALFSPLASVMSLCCRCSERLCVEASN